MNEVIHEETRQELEDCHSRICDKCKTVFSRKHSNEDIPFQEFCPVCNNPYLWSFRIFVYETPMYEKILEEY